MNWTDCLGKVKELEGKGIFDADVFKEVLHQLPYFYKEDEIFRLRFENAFPCGMPNNDNLTDPLLIPLVRWVKMLSLEIVHRPYNFTNLFCFHVQSNIKGKNFLEVGGFLPKEIVIDLFQVDSYLSIEGEEYVNQFELVSETYYEKSDSKDDNHRQIIADIESVSPERLPVKFDRVFSVACFEHIHDLESALERISSLMSKEGILYTYFAPIYSHFSLGDHGVIDRDLMPDQSDRNGLHILGSKSQSERLIKVGLKNNVDIQNALGMIHFDRSINRLYYEDYSRILSESPLFLLRFDQIRDKNMYKVFHKEIDLIRATNKRVNDLTTSGVRAVLAKAPDSNFIESWPFEKWQKQKK